MRIGAASVLAWLFLLPAMAYCPAAESPKTTSPGPGQPQQGLYAMTAVYRPAQESRQEFVRDNVEKPFQNNKHLSGVIVFSGWDEMEPEEGQIQWEILDRVRELARQYDKRYKLRIVPGLHTPKWVYAKGAKQFVGTIQDEHSRDQGKRFPMPLPWDETFLTSFQTFVQQIANRYADDPNLVAVTVTGANWQWAEMHMPKGPDDMRQWASYPDHQRQLLGVWKRMIDFYAQAFPRQQLALHVSFFFKGRPKAELEEIIQYGRDRYPDRFTLQNCQLDGRGDNARNFTYQMVAKHAERLHHGFQSVDNFTRNPKRAGNLRVAVWNYLRADAEYWELGKHDAASEEFCRTLLEELAAAGRVGLDAYRNQFLSEQLLKDE